MKLFAITTACLMAVGGGFYYYSNTNCSKSSCGLAPVAKTGGCCALRDTSACSTQGESCAIREASGMIAASVGGQPVEIAGCCDEACATPTFAVAAAATSIAAAK